MFVCASVSVDQRQSQILCLPGLPDRGQIVCGCTLSSVSLSFSFSLPLSLSLSLPLSLSDSPHTLWTSFWLPSSPSFLPFPPPPPARPARRVSHCLQALRSAVLSPCSWRYFSIQSEPLHVRTRQPGPGLAFPHPRHLRGPTASVHMIIWLQPAAAFFTTSTLYF